MDQSDEGITRIEPTCEHEWDIGDNFDFVCLKCGDPMPQQPEAPIACRQKRDEPTA